MSRDGRADPRRDGALGIPGGTVADGAVVLEQRVARRVHVAPDDRHVRPRRRGLVAVARAGGERIPERVGRRRLARGPLRRPVRLAAGHRDDARGRVARDAGGLVRAHVLGADHVVEPRDDVPEIVGRGHPVVPEVAPAGQQRQRGQPGNSRVRPPHGAPPRPPPRGAAARPARAGREPAGTNTPIWSSLYFGS